MRAYEFQMPGDLNGGGCVDQADLGILLAHLGEGCLQRCLGRIQ